MNDIRDDTRDGFAAVFGVAPSGLWSAPGTLSLLGGGAEPGATALSVAIGPRTVVALALRDDSLARVASSYADELVEIDLAEIAGLDPDAVRNSLSGWAAYPFGVAWALGREGADLAAVPGFDLFIESDVPVGVGLGSSAALQTAVALALDDVWRLGLDRSILAGACLAAERATVDRPASGQSASGRSASGRSASVTPFLTSLYGRPDSAVVVDTEHATAHPITLGFEAEELVILLIDSDAIDTTMIDTSAPSGAARISPTRMAAENERVVDAIALLGTAGPRAIGELLDASDAALRDASGASSAQLELALDTVRFAGSIGARMLGIGSGAAIAIVEAENLSRVLVAIDGAFSEHGYGPPDTFVVVAAHGASREP